MKDDIDFPFDFSTVDTSQPVADAEAIRKINPQRHEMEMLSGVVLLDRVKHIVVGFCDTKPEDFWCRGHMPGYPILPGVLMIEAAAQLVSFYSGTCGFVEPGKIMGLGGVEKSRFTRQVKPGERMIIAGKGIKITRRIVKYYCIAAVNNEKCFETMITGVVLPTTSREPARA
jgi:3-hydroxyacyl-[acyl-carrier-protein] dehydratase